MRFNRLDLNLLVALDAVLQTRSITQAAQRLHRTQPAVSNSLARLRDYFGDELLVPVGRGMELTRRGEDLRDAVRDLLLRLETTLQVEPDFDPVRSDRTFRIAASDYSAWVLLPQVVALANQAQAGVSIEVMPQVGDSARALERGEADVLIIPSSYCSAEHPSEALFTETYSCVMWAHNPLAQTPDGLISLAQYTQARHVVMQPAGPARPSLSQALLQQRELKRKVAVSTYGFMSELALVVGTDYLATAHTRLARWASTCMPVCVLPLPFQLPPMEQTMQWHKFRASDPGLIWLLQLIRSAAQRIDPPQP